MEAHGHDEAAFSKAAAVTQRATGLLPLGDRGLAVVLTCGRGLVTPHG
jgi:hypothetical protein